MTDDHGIVGDDAPTMESESIDSLMEKRKTFLEGRMLRACEQLLFSHLDRHSKAVNEGDIYEMVMAIVPLYMAAWSISDGEIREVDASEEAMEAHYWTGKAREHMFSRGMLSQCAEPLTYARTWGS